MPPDVAATSRKLRIISPDPTSSTTDTAVSETISNRLARVRRRSPVVDWLDARNP